MTKHITIIEATAAEFAATIYEIGRSQGMTSKYKTPRAYARAYWEYYIPKAIEHLTEMLGREDLPQNMKDEIYDALMERSNDPRMKPLDEKVPDIKPDLIAKSKFDEAWAKMQKDNANAQKHT